MLSFHWYSFCCVHDAWYGFPDVGNFPALITWKCAYLEEINNSLRCCLHHTWVPPSYPFILLIRTTSLSHPKVSICSLISWENFSKCVRVHYITASLASFRILSFTKSNNLPKFLAFVIRFLCSFQPWEVTLPDSVIPFISFVGVFLIFGYWLQFEQI